MKVLRGLLIVQMVIDAKVANVLKLFVLRIVKRLWDLSVCQKQVPTTDHVLAVKRAYGKIPV